MPNATVNRFRSRRGRLLRRQIEALADHFGRDIRVLDVGGRADYWANVGLGRIAHVELINYSASELERALPAQLPAEMFTVRVGDARDLGEHGDGAYDLVHSNSVIEHVGLWPEMRAMADELRRVGRSGWVQTPAWEFPVEPHFRAPILHWFGQPLRARMLSLSVEQRFRSMDLHARRRRIDTINLLSKREMQALFPGCPLHVERLILAKSYTARWVPEGVTL
jgi:hypothetical protein